MKKQYIHPKMYQDKIEIMSILAGSITVNEEQGNGTQLGKEWISDVDWDEEI